jgi:hypothetical protein
MDANLESQFRPQFGSSQVFLPKLLVRPKNFRLRYVPIGFTVFVFETQFQTIRLKSFSLKLKIFLTNGLAL